jgi:predicted RecB family nuclease
LGNHQTESPALKDQIFLGPPRTHLTHKVFLFRVSNAPDNPGMLITAEIFQAFLQCETKSYLKFLGVRQGQREVIVWQRRLAEQFMQECCVELRSHFLEEECFVGTPPPQDFESKKYPLVLDCLVQAKEIESRVHALERVAFSSRKKPAAYIPIRFVRSEKIKKEDKLLLAFDALVLCRAFGSEPPAGKFIYGCRHSSRKVDLDGPLKAARSLIKKLVGFLAQATPPDLALNRHCAECEFQAARRQKAVEKDDLSLLSGMSEKERKRIRNKGIFTVTQLSYTFRPRRRPKRLTSKREKFSYPLKALAIREDKIHVVGSPELKVNGTPVFLDVEGVPDRDFYYLIGMRIQSRDLTVQHSFWADNPQEEVKIWDELLHTLAGVQNPTLIHYGSYEVHFLKRMRKRYGNSGCDPAFLENAMNESVNLLSFIYAQIYFPTYSNGLKEIAGFLGFKWSAANPSGVQSLKWRYDWEESNDARVKQELLTYNAEDCEAVERVANTVSRLVPAEQTLLTAPSDADVVLADSLKNPNLYKWGKPEFLLPELDYVNRCAYWDYQRDKIYVRSSPVLKRAKRTSTKSNSALRINKIVAASRLRLCPNCGTKQIFKNGNHSKLLYDLKFTRTGVKRWIVRYHIRHYKCASCATTFVSDQHNWTRHRYGSELVAYVIYHTVELYMPQAAVARSANKLFGYSLHQPAINQMKKRTSIRYLETYETIKQKLVKGNLIHADETKVSLAGKSSFVWVFTSLEEVVYVCSGTREGEFLETFLQGFKGVLISDFYAAYDSIDCPQQKCLIHLIRDLNEDLRKEPFNEEMKLLVHEFAALLKPMIETIDRFGLKKHFLKKHQSEARRFYDSLLSRDYQTEVTVKYQKRFDKNQGKLFTFLDYDGVTWNNNNAEHAIKAFASLRNVIRGSSNERGVRDYLILLSVCQTCKYKGVDFLDFLRSGEKDIDEFMKRG